MKWWQIVLAAYGLFLVLASGFCGFVKATRERGDEIAEFWAWEQEMQEIES